MSNVTSTTAPKADAAKVGPPKADAPKGEPPKADAPKVGSQAEVEPDLPEVVQAAEVQAKAKLRQESAEKAAAAAKTATAQVEKAEPGDAKVKAEYKAEAATQTADTLAAGAELAGILADLTQAQGALAGLTRITSKELYKKGDRVWKWARKHMPGGKDVKASAVIERLKMETWGLKVALDEAFARRCLRASDERDRANECGLYQSWAKCTSDKEATALLDAAEGKAAKARKVQTPVQRFMSALNGLESSADMRAARLALEEREKKVAEAEKAKARAQANTAVAA